MKAIVIALCQKLLNKKIRESLTKCPKQQTTPLSPMNWPLPNCSKTTAIPAPLNFPSLSPQKPEGILLSSAKNTETWTSGSMPSKIFSKPSPNSPIPLQKREELSQKPNDSFSAHLMVKDASINTVVWGRSCLSLPLGRWSPAFCCNSRRSSAILLTLTFLYSSGMYFQSRSTSRASYELLSSGVHKTM